MSGSLKHKAVSGIKWQVINNVLQKVISVGTFAILARILEPSVFGLFAMAFIAIDGLGMFKTFGLDAGIVQKKDTPEATQHTAFFLIQAMGVVLFLLCFGFAPFAGRFFNNPEVGSILRALGVIFIMTGFGRVPAAILTKEMRFRLMSLIELVGSVVNSAFAVAFALVWQNVWALVAAYLIKQVTMTTLTWYYSGYRMKWQFDKKAAMDLFHFGKYMVGLSILWYLGANISNTVVGKIMGATALGYFALANNIGNFINTNFTYIISRIMFPAYSAIQGDPEVVKRAYLKTVKFISMFSIPFSITLICLAKEITLTLYGEKWLPMAPLLQFFGVIQMIVPITICSGALFRGCGKPGWDFYITLWNLGLRIPTLILSTMWWGLTGALVSTIILSLIFTPINLYLDRKIVRFNFKELWTALLPSIVCSIIMMASIILLKQIVFYQPFLAHMLSRSFLQLIIFGLAGAGAYLAAFFIVDRSAAFEIFRMLFKLEKA